MNAFRFRSRKSIVTRVWRIWRGSSIKEYRRWRVSRRDIKSRPCMIQNEMVFVSRLSKISIVLGVLTVSRVSKVSRLSILSRVRTSSIDDRMSNMKDQLSNVKHLLSSIEHIAIEWPNIRSSAADLVSKMLCILHVSCDYYD